MAKKGQSLGAFLSEAIDSMEDDRSDVVTRMASAASIEENTVNSILSGSITCPPLERLRAFARVLNISMDSILDAGNEDGCEYEKSAGDKLFDKGTKFLAKYAVKKKKKKGK